MERTSESKPDSDHHTAPNCPTRRESQGRDRTCGRMTQRMVYVVIVAMTLWDFEPKIRYAEGRERGLIRWSVGYKVVHPAPGQANVSDVSGCVAFDLHRGRDRAAGFGEARGWLGFCAGTVQGSRLKAVKGPTTSSSLRASPNNDQ
jgi:hypothetical protein